MPTRRRRCLWFGGAVVLGTALCSAGCGRPDNYFPLAEGNVWVYDGMLGTKRVSGERSVVARTRVDSSDVFAVQFQLGKVNETQIWKSDRLGVAEVVSSPFEADQSFTARVLAIPPRKGASFSADDPSSTGAMGFRVTYQVISPAERLSLPVGVVRATHVRRTLVLRLPGQEARIAGSDYWFTRFVGIVQESHPTPQGRLTLKLRLFVVR